MDFLENSNEAGLCFKPAFSAHKLESGDVAVLSEEQSFVLSGPEYIALAPLLDGSRNSDAVADCLSDRFPPERVYYALARLQARGVLSAGIIGDSVPQCPDEEDSPALVQQTTPSHVVVHTVTVRQPLASRIESRVIIPPITVSGWGKTDAESRERCLAEAAERRAGLIPAESPIVRARLTELGSRAIPPDDLTMFDDDQYAHRDRLNERYAGSSWIPDRFDPAAEIDWVAAWSLRDGRHVWLPAAYCFYACPRTVGATYCVADSNGCAAGRTLDEAALRGFLELVERDASAIWWYNRVCRPQIDVRFSGDPFAIATHDALRQHGRMLKLFDLTHDLGIPVVAAVSWRTSDTKGLRLGFGARFDLHGAVTQALGELNQLVFANDDSAACDPVPHQLYAADPNIHAALAEHDGTHRTEDANSLENCIELLRRRGLQMIVLDQTEAQGPFRVARVVVPGLRHTAARFAPGRLRDVPVELGWRQEMATQNELETAPAFPWSSV